MTEDQKFVLAVDMKAKKVGCVLLQAVYRTDYQQIPFMKFFPSKTWILHPSEDLMLYNISGEDIKKLSTYLIERYKNV